MSRCFWEVVRNKPVTVRMDGDGLTPILETSCPKQRAMFANVRHVREPSAAPEEVNFTIATLRRARCVVPIDTEPRLKLESESSRQDGG